MQALNTGQDSRETSPWKWAIIGLCLIVCVVAAIKILYWYRIQRMPPADANRIPRIKWSRLLDRTYPVWTEPFVGNNGTLYIAAADGVHAIDASSATRWEYRMTADEGIMHGGLSQDAGRNLYFAANNTVYSLTSDGVKRWQTSCKRAAFARTEQGWATSGDLVYTTCDTHFAALSKSDGSETWTLQGVETQGPPLMAGSPVMLRNGTILFGKDQHIFATDRSGNALWTYPDATHGASLLGAGPGDTVYALEVVTGFNALDSNTGSIKWTIPGGANLGFATPPQTTPDGTTYVVIARALLALAPDGSLKWRFLLPEKSASEYGFGAPLIASDGIVYLLLEHRIVAASPEGKQVWELNLPGPGIEYGYLSLAMDGTLYVVTNEAMIIAVQTASRGPMQTAGGTF